MLDLQVLAYTGTFLGMTHSGYRYLFKIYPISKKLEIMYLTIDEMEDAWKKYGEMIDPKIRDVEGRKVSSALVTKFNPDKDYLEELMIHGPYKKVLSDFKVLQRQWIKQFLLFLFVPICIPIACAIVFFALGIPNTYK